MGKLGDQRKLSEDRVISHEDDRTQGDSFIAARMRSPAGSSHPVSLFPRDKQDEVDKDAIIIAPAPRADKHSHRALPKK